MARENESSHVCFQSGCNRRLPGDLRRLGMNELVERFDQHGVSNLVHLNRVHRAVV